jgi:hypothetical protein
VVGESEVVSRFEALRSGTTPLIGRDEELDVLTRRWRQAKSGAGRVVLVSREPGIGKSRLTAALSQRIESEPHTRLRYFCSPHDQDSALHPGIGQLERAAGFTRDDTTATKLDKLEALLGAGAEPGDICGLCDGSLCQGEVQLADLYHDLLRLAIGQLLGGFQRFFGVVEPLQAAFKEGWHSFLPMITSYRDFLDRDHLPLLTSPPLLAGVRAQCRARCFFAPAS